MSQKLLAKSLGLVIALALSLTTSDATAEPRHGIAMVGEPALPPDFVSLPYANPQAPTGGRIVTAEVGSFDSLNPYVQKGTPPYQLAALTGESLMGRSLDEPFTLYGLLAESVETGPNREWVEFTLNPAARFADGSPVTTEDVIWSFRTLGTEGNLRYAGFWKQVAKIEETGPGRVRITFAAQDPELAMLAGLRPILKKAPFDGLDFTATDGFDHVPVTSGPYVIASYEPSRQVTLKRNPDYWGKDIPFRRGTANLDEIRLEYFADETAAFEAFKTGAVTFTREFNAARWDSQYDFPRARSGEVVKELVPHHRPTGMTGFVMNTRHEKLADWRVRDALMLAFNFEYINQTVTGGAQPRIASYFSNSPLGMEPGPATGAERALLEPFAADLPSGALDGYALPVSDGSQRNRKNIAAALDELEQAGWTVQDGTLKNAAGDPFTLDILMQTGGSEVRAILDIYTAALQRLGIAATVSAVDPAQYRQRTDAYDFDLTFFRRALSLSPGNEQRLYWGSAEADAPGGRNLMGVKSPAIDSMIDAILAAKDQDQFRAATRALDRVLMAGRYVIPIYSWEISRIAYDRHLHHPATIPLFGDWPGWEPEVWWWQD
jgi:peptide/nickel transport system substrate-binding protein